MASSIVPTTPLPCLLRRLPLPVGEGIRSKPTGYVCACFRPVFTFRTVEQNNRWLRAWSHQHPSPACYAGFPSPSERGFARSRQVMCVLPFGFTNRTAEKKPMASSMVPLRMGRDSRLKGGREGCCWGMARIRKVMYITARGHTGPSAKPEPPRKDGGQSVLPPGGDRQPAKLSPRPSAGKNR